MSGGKAPEVRKNTDGGAVVSSRLWSSPLKMLFVRKALGDDLEEALGEDLEDALGEDLEELYGEIQGKPLLSKHFTIGRALTAFFGRDGTWVP